MIKTRSEEFRCLIMEQRQLDKELEAKAPEWRKGRGDNTEIQGMEEGVKGEIFLKGQKR